jgi:2,5-furandicarboxylate decarboxylase 1
VIVDDDIDVFDGTEVEWAVATRVQADRDVMVISGARSKPLDPSLPPVPGRIPTTGKLGIDATIPDDVPRERFQRMSYAYANQVTLAQVMSGGSGAKGVSGAKGKAQSGAAAADSPVGAPADSGIAALAAQIREVIGVEPLYFAELAERFEAHGFQAVARAVGALHEAGDLWQDPVGRYCLTGSDFAAKSPE